jgi:branched-chain amino acid transport system permease protein
LLKSYGVSAEVAMLGGGLIGALLGLCFGWLAIRRQGVYFAMITLALAQMVYFVCLQAPFTGGEDGIQKIPRGALFGYLSLESDLSMFLVAVAVFVLGLLFVHRIIHSPFGQVLKGIRENEARSISLGYRTTSYKLIVFVLSAFLAGVAGGMKAQIFGLATLSDVNIATSSAVIMMALVGGIGTVFGPVIGALVVVALDTYLAPFGAWMTVAQGVVFLIFILAFRRGVIGEVGGRLGLQL